MTFQYFGTEQFSSSSPPDVTFAVVLLPAFVLEVGAAFAGAGFFGAAPGFLGGIALIVESC